MRGVEEGERRGKKSGGGGGKRNWGEGRGKGGGGGGGGGKPKKIFQSQPFKAYYYTHLI